MRSPPDITHGCGPTSDGSGRLELLKAIDKAKDQSYFLHRLTQAQLAPTIFPLGSMKKSDVRAIAKRERIPTWGKKDSTGICFIGERPFRDFLARYLPRTPGPIITPEGRNVGTHSGLAYYTLGQRQGLGVGGQRDADSAPWFVAAKDSARNALIAVQGHDHPLLYRPRDPGNRRSMDRRRHTVVSASRSCEDAIPDGGCRLRDSVGQRPTCVCDSMCRSGHRRRDNIW
jgi:tRNA U34 2-thiouridine synthase MnmA/TrmU